MPPSPAVLSSTLCAFLEGDAVARDELPRMIESDIARMAAKIASPELRRRALVPDVIGRTWELLVRRPAGSYDPRRGSPMAYLASLVRTASRDVRQQYAPEVRRSRDYTSESARRVPKQSEPVASPNNNHHELDDLIERAFGHDHVAMRAARLIAFGDRTLSDAAIEVGVSRFVLKRRLGAWSMGRESLAA